MPSMIPLALSAPRPSPVKVLSRWYLLANETDYLGLGYPTEVDGTQCWKMAEGQVLPWSAVVYWGSLTSLDFVKGRLPSGPLFDEDGYPTSSALLAVECWPWHDPVGALELARTLWSYPTRAIREPESPGVLARFSFSTGGWSGNESVIAALERNQVLWATTWKRSERGGWYLFEVKAE